jgi:hypothetical protein
MYAVGPVIVFVCLCLCFLYFLWVEPRVQPFANPPRILLPQPKNAKVVTYSLGPSLLLSLLENLARSALEPDSGEVGAMMYPDSTGAMLVVKDTIRMGGRRGLDLDPQLKFQYYVSDIHTHPYDLDRMTSGPSRSDMESTLITLLHHGEQHSLVFTQAGLYVIQPNEQLIDFVFKTCAATLPPPADGIYYRLQKAVRNLYTTAIVSVADPTREYTTLRHPLVSGTYTSVYDPAKVPEEFQQLDFRMYIHFYAMSDVLAADLASSTAKPFSYQVLELPSADWSARTRSDLFDQLASGFYGEQTGLYPDTMTAADVTPVLSAFAQIETVEAGPCKLDSLLTDTNVYRVCQASIKGLATKMKKVLGRAPASIQDLVKNVFVPNTPLPSQ